MNGGWSASAGAWIASLGGEGDFTRRYVTDPVMVARIEGRGFRAALDVGCGEGASAASCASSESPRPALIQRHA